MAKSAKLSMRNAEQVQRGDMFRLGAQYGIE